MRTYLNKKEFEKYWATVENKIHVYLIIGGVKEIAYLAWKAGWEAGKEYEHNEMFESDLIRKRNRDGKVYD